MSAKQIPPIESPVSTALSTFTTELASFTGRFIQVATKLDVTKPPQFNLLGCTSCIADNTLSPVGDSEFPGCYIPEEGFEGVSHADLIIRRDAWEYLDKSADFPPELLERCIVRPAGYALIRCKNPKALTVLTVNRPTMVDPKKFVPLKAWCFAIFSIHAPTSDGVVGDPIGYAKSMPMGSVSRAQNALKTLANAQFANPLARARLISGVFDGAAGSMASVNSIELKEDGKPDTVISLAWKVGK